MTLRPEVPNTPAIQKKKKKTLETAKRKDLKENSKKKESRDRETITYSDRKKKENNK